MHREIAGILAENKHLCLKDIESILHKMNPNLSISIGDVLSIKQSIFLYERINTIRKPVIEEQPQIQNHTSSATPITEKPHKLKKQKSKAINSKNKSKKIKEKECKPKVKRTKGANVLPPGKPMFESTNIFKKPIIKNVQRSAQFPPEFFYDKENRNDKEVSYTTNHDHKRIIYGEHEVTKTEKERFRKKVNLRSKEFVRKSLQCDICAKYSMEGFRYTDHDGWIYHVCRSCAAQIGGASGRKTIIYTPMGGQNKRY